MHETNLNIHGDNKHNSNVSTENNPLEHNFNNHGDIINFSTSSNNQSNNNQCDYSSIIKKLLFSNKGNQLKSD